MRETRRHLLTNVMVTVATLAFGKLAYAQGRLAQPAPMPSPNAPDPNNPGGLDGLQAKKDSPVMNPQSQKQIREDVQKLYDMATELKKQVEAADLNGTLSLSVVKKAQQIEKLAKQIRERAKG